MAESNCDWMLRTVESASSGCAPEPFEPTANCALRSWITLFHAETNVLTEDSAVDVSGDTVTFTVVPGLALARFNVTPGITPEIVLLAEEMGMPSTTREASAPVTALLKVSPGVLFEMRILLGVRVVLLTRASRSPFVSFTTLAVTPRFWLLMEDASPSSVLFVLLTVMVVGAPVPTASEKLPAASAVLLDATGSV